MTLTLDAATDDVDLVQGWDEWHRDHERRRADPHGFLAITAIGWLSAAPTAVDGAPGRWSSTDAGVVVELGSEVLVLDGRRITGTHTFAPLAERASVFVRHGDTVVEIARRGGHDIVRPRVPTHPLRLAYQGTPTYPPSRRWVADGCFEAFDVPRPTTVGAAVDGLQHVYDAVGVVRFWLAGSALELIAFPASSGDALMVLFTDATSGVTTYAANRMLSVAAPGPDGRVRLDFNRAVNLPCAYTAFATCPLPPAENRLPVAVEAGEKTPLVTCP